MLYILYKIYVWIRKYKQHRSFKTVSVILNFYAIINVFLIMFLNGIVDRTPGFMYALFHIIYQIIFNTGSSKDK